MTPEQAHFLLNDVYLPQIRNEQKTTRRIIEAIPDNQLEYKPDPKAKGAMELAKHLASSEVFFIQGAASGAFNRDDAAIPDSVKTPAQLGKWYEEHVNKAVTNIAATKPQDLVKDINFAIFTLPAINYIGLMLSHSVHHRGQLSTYLRPMGSKIPKIYGGSADEPVEIPQAQAQAK
jgi:uncharacterized damage-inducible protein DinB